jgi:transitional endoplasmic reticulum ATPase
VTMNVDVYLKKGEEYIENASKAEENGELRKARDWYLKASEQLFNAASQSSGRMRNIRIENAEKLLEKVKSLKVTHKEVESGGEPASFTVTEKPNVGFDDVAGLDNVKEEIRNKLIYPSLYPEKAELYGIRSGGGILLYGPPGTGKTYIAKAVAGEVDAVFYSIKPSEVLSKWVGESEQNVKKLFETARGNERSVIFIDEVEALIPKRRSSGSTVMQRVVPQILAELEGIESKNDNLLFVGATNEPWSIDPAALRPGRFDEKIYVPPPDYEARKKIFELNLKGKPLDEIGFDALAELTEGYSGADLRHICVKASLIPFKESIKTGEERGIAMDDMRSVMGDIKPSINREMVRKYEEFKF